MMFLSLVLPCYNEERVIESSARTLIELMSRYGVASDDFEILFVIENGTDNSLQLAEGLSRKFSQVKVLANDACYGKGYSVRRGVLASSGDYILTVDADLPINLNKYFPLMMSLINLDRADAVYAVALGDKTDPKKRGLTRTITSFSLFTLRRWFLGHNVTDSQLGCKLFRGQSARELFRSVNENGFLYELQVLDLMNARGCVIEECSVRIDSFASTSTVTLKSIFGSFFKFLHYITVGRRNLISKT